MKLPKGMSQAEYNTLKTRYQFSENITLTEKRIKKILSEYIFKDESIGLIDSFMENHSYGKQLIKEVTASPLHGTDADDGPATWYVNFKHYSKDVRELAEKGGMKIIDYLVTGVSNDYSNTADYLDAIAVSFFPAGVAGKSTPTDYAD